MRIREFNKRFLSAVLAVMIEAGVIPLSNVYAVNTEVKNIYNISYANNWARSDIRAYLNGGLKGEVEGTDYKTPNLNSKTEKPSDSAYAEHFTDTELGLIQNSTIETNILFPNSIYRESSYKTTDKFFLPSANSRAGTLISWSNQDINDSVISSDHIKNHLNKAIPKSYFVEGGNTNWLRSPSDISFTTGVSASGVGKSTGNIDVLRAVDVDQEAGVAPAFRLDLSSIIFASNALAANFVKDPAEKFEVKNVNIGQNTVDARSEYGMYLKKENTNNNFSVNSLSLNNNDLTVNYNGGEVDKYIMVCAYETDKTGENDTNTAYGAAKKITNSTVTDGSFKINVTEWGLSSLDNYTIKVWMEDVPPSGSLATATIPQTYFGSGGLIGTSGSEAINNRVFAMKNNLKCSWGNLSKPSTELIIDNPTNQKIYYGTYIDADDGNQVKPLQFWIAGREDANNSVTSDGTGETMILYQAKAVEKSKFNNTKEYYSMIHFLDDINNTLAGSSDATWSTLKTPNFFEDTNNTTDGVIEQFWLFSTDSGITWEKATAENTISKDISGSSAKVKYFASVSHQKGYPYALFSKEANLTIQNTVAITPGINMTPNVLQSQTVKGGDAITDIVFTANEGNYFPADYSVPTVDGISVTKNNSGQITVSGTPTSDINIMLDNAIAKIQETTPTITIDYEKENLTGFANGTYTIDGSEVVLSNGTLNAADYMGSTISIIKKATDAQTTIDSNAQSLVVPARPNSPEVDAINETVDGRGDGRISKTTEAMEYKKSSDMTWNDCTNTEVTGLVSGNYQVRTKATTVAFASPATDVTIAKGAEQTRVLNVTAPIFEKVTIGYDQPNLKSIIISNSGNSDSTISSVTVSGTAFTIGDSNNKTVASNGGTNNSFTIWPKAGLEAGIHTETITVSYDNNKTATATIGFTVNPKTYQIIIEDSKGGKASATPTSATEGAEVNLTAIPNKEYSFKEWQVVGGTVTITDNKFTMPDKDVTVRAVFEKNPNFIPGDSTTPSNPDNKIDQTGTTNVPKTGDSISLKTLCALAILLIISGGVLFGVKRKRTSK